MGVATQRPYRVDDLAAFPDDGKLREVVDGQVVEWDVTTLRHGAFANLLATIITNLVRMHRLGTVVTTDALFRILGSAYHARGGDIAFFAHGRLPADLDAAATDVTPDLVVEVLSPNDRADQVQAKVLDWLRAGVRLLWYVDPATGVTSVHRPGGSRIVGADEPLDGEPVLPGFSLRLRELLDELAAEQPAR
jgi:Uma2 family endonuclease